MAANEPDSTATPQPQEQAFGGTRLRNFLIALVAIALTVALFFGFRTETPSVALEALAESSTPLDVAISNGKPTLMEFYANWCSSCQAMAKDMEQLKQQYSDNLNFVMLNVDNTKWLPELMRYRVDAIPHFVFLDQDGKAIAQTLGEQPRPVMQANLEALVAGVPLPYIQATGQISTLESRVVPANPSPDDPRAHSSLVKS